jgi:hypothetical protein
MEKWETFWRFTVTGLAVWRVSKLLIERKGGEDRPEMTAAPAGEAGALRFWAGRAVDLGCWISVWMSSQTAIWVTCGLAGVFLSWLTACGVSRLFPHEPEAAVAESSRPPLREEISACGEGMRVRNG